MSFKTEFENFYKNNFGDVHLSSPVFYKFPIGIRFEIGNDDIEDKVSYIKQATLRAKTIFNELFNEIDQIYIIADSYEKFKDFYDGQIYNTIGIINSLILKKHNEYCYEKLTFKYDDDNMEYPYSRYIIETSVNFLNINELLSKIVHSDLGGDPFLNGNIYIINKKSGVLYFLYDDRGLDVVANKTEKLYGIYHKFNDWILEYDRKKIESVFK